MPDCARNPHALLVPHIHHRNPGERSRIVWLPAGRGVERRLIQLHRRAAFGLPPSDDARVEGDHRGVVVIEATGHGRLSTTLASW